METPLELPEKVKRDTLAYRLQVERFLAGEFSPAAFRAYRVPMGIYEQRQSGTYMVRVRIGAGIALAAQLRRIAGLSRDYGSGVVHVTTRQDMQIHSVKIEQTPDVLEGLLEAGLSSRGGGGNTVRNVTACPRAGICPFEQFDVSPHAMAVAQYLMQFDSSYNLPRKYKIAFSGCSRDCSLACVADLGFFAHRRNGMRGFAVYAGGGLGANPAVAVKIEDFIGEHQVFEVAEAIKRLFDRYGDRSNKHRARLRYVVARFGEEEFVRLYRKERASVERQGLEGVVPAVAHVPEQPGAKVSTAEVAAPDLRPGRVCEKSDSSDPSLPPAGTGKLVCPWTLGGASPTRETPSNKSGGATGPASHTPSEKRKGFHTVRLMLPLGDVPADDLLRIADIAEAFGVGVVRATQQQDLLIPSIPKAKVGVVRERLRALSIDVSRDGLPKVVACAGASTCKLGLCQSRGLAKAVEDALAQRQPPGPRDMTIRISGCPNSCGQHTIGDLGFQGHAKRVNGRLMPCYDVLAGARIAEGAARLAELIGTLPAKRVPEFVTQVFEAGALTPDRLRQLVQAHAEVPAADVPEDYYRDWGSDAPFSLAGRGPGECGAGVMDIIEVDIAEARQALKHAAASAERERSASTYGALLASARALLVIFGSEPKTDREVFEAFRRHIVEPGWVEPSAGKLLDSAVEWRMGDVQTLADSLAEVEKLVGRVEELFRSLDANLKFRLEPVKALGQSPMSEAVHRVDLRGVPCPLNFVKAKLAIDRIGVGETLEIELDDGEPIQNVPPSLADQGHEIVEIKAVGTHHLLRVVRKD